MAATIAAAAKSVRISKFPVGATQHQQPAPRKVPRLLPKGEVKTQMMRFEKQNGIGRALC
jgi:hypothetical protein